MASADETFPDPNKPEPKQDQGASGGGPQTINETLDQFGGGADETARRGSVSINEIFGESDCARRGAAETSGEGGREPPGDATQNADSTDKTQESADRTSAKAPGGTDEARPTDPPSYERYARSIIDAVQDRASAAKLDSWWASDAERKLRNSCHVDMTLFNQLKDAVSAKVSQFNWKNTPKK
jgi:hypothetical protein